MPESARVIADRCAGRNQTTHLIADVRLATGLIGRGSLEKRCPSDGGPRVRIHLPPAASLLRTCIFELAQSVGHLTPGHSGETQEVKASTSAKTTPASLNPRFVIQEVLFRVAIRSRPHLRQIGSTPQITTPQSDRNPTGSVKRAAEDCPDASIRVYGN